MQNVHKGQPVLASGTPLEQAKAALIMIHGRGATAQSILALSRELTHPAFAYLAPQAQGNQWYPYRFIEPIETNQPYLDSALQAVDDLVKHINQAGITSDKIMLLGFSQGACLALEYAIRHATRYGGVIGLSGGLIGEVGTTWEYSGSLAETPVFLGCDPHDFHIPEARVHESADVFARYGAVVTKRIYPQMGHTISEDEIKFVRDLMATFPV